MRKPVYDEHGVEVGLFGPFGKALDYDRMADDDRKASEAHMRHCGYGRGMRGRDI